MKDGINTDGEISKMSTEPEGEVKSETRTIQQLSRVAVPEEWWEEYGLSVGDEVVVKKEDDHIEIHSMEKVISEL